MRGADGGPWRRLCALPAFWVCNLTLGFMMLFFVKEGNKKRVLLGKAPGKGRIEYCAHLTSH